MSKRESLLKDMTADEARVVERQKTIDSVSATRAKTSLDLTSIKNKKQRRQYEFQLLKIDEQLESIKTHLVNAKQEIVESQAKLTEIDTNIAEEHKKIKTVMAKFSELNKLFFRGQLKDIGNANSIVFFFILF